MKRIRKRPCRHCHVFFLPDHRNAERQNFCSKPECRRASHAASQKAWLRKNPDYFKGSVHVERVREWRRNNPGHRHRKKSSTGLQDDCKAINTQKQNVAKHYPAASPAHPPVLQDLCLTQHPVIIGLIMQLTGLVLQDDIAAAVNRLAQSGHDVLIGLTNTQGGHYEPQVPHLSRSHPQDSRTIQLGGSPSGP